MRVASKSGWIWVYFICSEVLWTPGGSRQFLIYSTISSNSISGGWERENAACTWSETLCSTSCRIRHFSSLSSLCGRAGAFTSAGWVSNALDRMEGNVTWKPGQAALIAVHLKARPAEEPKRGLAAFFLRSPPFPVPSSACDWIAGS